MFQAIYLMNNLINNKKGILMILLIVLNV